MTNLALFISSFHAQSATATEHVCLCCRTFTKLSLNSTLKMLRVCSKWVYNPRPFITVPCGFFWNMRRENWKVLPNPSHLFHNSQEPILFAISARENIAFGVEELKKKNTKTPTNHICGKSSFDSVLLCFSCPETKVAGLFFWVPGFRRPVK